MNTRASRPTETSGGPELPVIARLYQVGRYTRASVDRNHPGQPLTHLAAAGAWRQKAELRQIMIDELVAERDELQEALNNAASTADYERGYAQGRFDEEMAKGPNPWPVDSEELLVEAENVIAALMRDTKDYGAPALVAKRWVEEFMAKRKAMALGLVVAAVAGEPQAATQGERQAFDAYFCARHNLPPETRTEHLSDPLAAKALEAYRAWQARAAQAGKAAAPTDGHLREVLRELLESSQAEQPSFWRGQEAQDEWADRRAKARNDAVSVLAQPALQATPTDAEIRSLWQTTDTGDIEDDIMTFARALVSLQAGKPQDIDTGDTVRHVPSDEEWLVAFVENGRLCACGWPCSFVPLTDCVLLEKASTVKRDNLLQDMANISGDDPRRSYALSALAVRKATGGAAP